MKIKYFRLSKEEQKKYKKEYFNSKNGKNMKKYLNLGLLSFILVLCIGIFCIFDAFMNNLSLWDKLYGFILVIFGIIGLLFYFKVKYKKINEYVISKK